MNGGDTKVIATLRTWPVRRWSTALVVGVAVVVAMGVPTALIPTPYFGREVPPTWWAWPALLVTAVLSGLLAATYVRTPSHRSAAEPAGTGSSGWFGGLLTFFAVGCPVCNKLVVMALGSAGAMTWFAPFQPILQAVALGLLGWALYRRLRGETFCPTEPDSTVPREVHV